MTNEENSLFSNSAGEIRDILGISTEPIAVYLLGPSDDFQPFASYRPLHGARYCQALMLARHGESVTLNGDGLACPAAAAAFGFRPLPEKLAGGEGLIGFGITREAIVGRTMFENMPHLDANSVSRLALCPLAVAPRLPDVVVVEGLPEQLMWLVLADLNRAGGERRRAHTAVLQATCVDATVVPHLERRLNFSLGCYGCRDATDIEPSETVVGFPGEALTDLVEWLRYLSEKAIPRSRAKNVNHQFFGKESKHV